MHGGFVRAGGRWGGTLGFGASGECKRALIILVDGGEVSRHDRCADNNSNSRRSQTIVSNGTNLIVRTIL